MRLISGFFADLPNGRLFENPHAFVVQILPTWTWFFLRKRQILLFIQDPIHLATKWRNRMLSKTAQMVIGQQTVSLTHLADIVDDDRLSKIDHGLTMSDLNPKDRQNFQSCSKISSEDVLNILRDNAETQATYLYLQLLKYIIMAYIEKSTLIHDRLYYSWLVVFVCRFWSTWIKCKSFDNKATTASAKDKDKYFITMPAYWSVEINAHNLLYLILLVQQQQLPVHALNIFLFNSQACESIFRNARALSGCYSTRINFTIDDFIRRAEKLAVLQHIKCIEQSNNHENHLIFPVHHKHKKEGLLPPQNIMNVDDLDVEEIISKAYKHAQRYIDILKMAPLLKQQHAYEMNDLSNIVEKHLKKTSKMKDRSKLKSDYGSGMDEITLPEIDDDEDDENGSGADGSGSDGDGDDGSGGDDDDGSGGDDDDASGGDDDDGSGGDGDEDDDENNRITTEKTAFEGIRIKTSIDTNLRDSYFRVIINDSVKYIHKQTACWMLTEKQNRLSSDRLSRVMEMNKKE